MMIECRTAVEGVRIGWIDVPKSIWDKRDEVAFPYTNSRGFPDSLDLIVGKWRDQIDGPERRVFKVKDRQIATLRRTPGFEEDETFIYFARRYSIPL